MPTATPVATAKPPPAVVSVKPPPVVAPVSTPPPVVTPPPVSPPPVKAPPPVTPPPVTAPRGDARQALRCSLPWRRLRRWRGTLCCLGQGSVKSKNKRRERGGKKKSPPAGRASQPAPSRRAHHRGGRLGPHHPPTIWFSPTKANRTMRQIAAEIERILKGIIAKRENALRAGQATSDDLLGLLLDSNMAHSREGGNSKARQGTISSVHVVGTTMDGCKFFEKSNNNYI
ncbi:hypothetical protein ZWY2020_022238 [Hordeum vulgare]|nr:hypothetical protein ZWY2020_022238 [Hordeum vulgare]